MNVLVTGATGFIGSHTIGELLNQGRDIAATYKNQEKARSYEWFSWVRYIS